MSTEDKDFHVRGTFVMKVKAADSAAAIALAMWTVAELTPNDDVDWVSVTQESFSARELTDPRLRPS